MAKKSKKRVSRVSNQNCITGNCPNAAFYVASMLCHACYSGQHYWLKKSVTERAKRRRKLDILAHRLDDLT